VTWFNEQFVAGPGIVLDQPAGAERSFLLGTPDPRIDPETFSGFFSAQFVPEWTEPYTFYTASDDGIDLAIVNDDTGGLLLFGPSSGLLSARAMPDVGFQDTIGTVQLTAGKRYGIHWRMNEITGNAGYRVGWSSHNTPQEVIPTSLLFPAVLAPRDVQAAPLCEDGIAVAFTDVSNAETGFDIQRSDSPSGPFQTIATLPPSPLALHYYLDATSATNPMAMGQSFYYRVRTNGYDAFSFHRP
jgi:hypothetical protein